MPVGALVNCAAVVLGGLLGSLVGDRLSEGLKETLTTVFGVCALTMGITSVVLMRNMPAVVFAVIVGTLLGILLDLDGLIRKGTGKALDGLGLSIGGESELMLTALVLFCASGTGIYGSLVSGMTGDHSILIAKSVLDFFTAMIFACRLKRAVCLIGVPQLAVMLLLFFGARLILPLTTDTMIADFKAAGGVVLLATGFSIMGVKKTAVANMIPAMVLAMPLSALWTNLLLPLL